jgi:uncharacterized membrane protein
VHVMSDLTVGILPLTPLPKTICVIPVGVTYIVNTESFGPYLVRLVTRVHSTTSPKAPSFTKT